MTHVDRILGLLAAPQAGAFTTRQALHAGISHGSLLHRRESGLLVHPHAGVWSFAHTCRSHDTRTWLAVLSAGADAYLAREAAAQRYGISRRRHRPIELLVTTRTRPITGVRIRHTTTLVSEDTTRVGCLPTTSVERTIVDLADERTELELCHYLRQAEFHGILDRQRLHRTMARNSGRHGAGRMLRALKRYLGGDKGTDSDGEERLARMLRRSGIHDAVHNKVLTIHGTEVRVDVFVPSARVIGELDPDHHHRLAPVLREDALRDALTRSIDCLTVRCDPHGCARAFATSRAR